MRKEQIRPGAEGGGEGGCHDRRWPRTKEPTIPRLGLGLGEGISYTADDITYIVLLYSTVYKVVHTVTVQ